MRQPCAWWCVEASDVAAYVKAVHEGQALLKKKGSAAELHVWIARYAGENAGSVVVTVEYPSLEALAKDDAMMRSDAELSRLAGTPGQAAQDRVGQHLRRTEALSSPPAVRAVLLPRRREEDQAVCSGGRLLQQQQAGPRVGDRHVVVALELLTAGPSAPRIDQPLDQLDALRSRRARPGRGSNSAPAIPGRVTIFSRQFRSNSLLMKPARSPSS